MISAILPSPESVQIIIVIITFVLLLMCLKNPVYGVISYFVIMNAQLGSIYPALGAIRYELTAAVIVLIRIVLSGHGLVNILPRRNHVNGIFWLWLFVSMLSVALSIDAALSWEMGGYYLLKLGVLYIMIVATVRTMPDLVKMLWALVLVAGWTAYEPVMNYLSGNVTQMLYGSVAYGRLGAAAGHVALANTLNQAIPLTLLFMLSFRKQYLKFTSAAVLLLLVTGVYVSKSRGGFLGLLLTIPGLIYFSKNRMRASVIAGCFLIVLFTAAAADYLAHMATIQQGIHGGRSAYDRYLGLVNGISMMLKRPLLGVGVGCYAEARRQYFQYYFFAHNLYGELLGELGLASFLWFYLVYRVLKGTSRLKQGLDALRESDVFMRNVLNAIQIAVVVRLIIGNFSHGYYIWFWFVMAALTVSIRNVLEDERRAGAARHIEGSRFTTEQAGRGVSTA